MKHTRLTFALLGGLILGTGTVYTTPAWAENITFPADAGVINVRDFGAKGDGKTDDTVAIQKAIDHYMGQFRILYFPNGTYLVTNKLSYGGDIGRAKQFVMQGQSEAGTVIKLSDNAPGYEAGQRKFLLTMYEGGSTGQAFHNFIYNMTFDVGKGNPGAVALQWMNNNEGGLQDITLRSSDPQRRGHTGLDLTAAWPGPALFKRLHIEGFDYGVKTAHFEYSLTFEHLKLKGQRKAGIYNQDNVLSIRDLQSDNRVPAIDNVAGAGLITLLDSNLTGGAAGTPAIINRGKLFLRDVKAAGYGSLLDNRIGAMPGIDGLSVSEYSSHGPRKLFAQALGADLSLHLPVEETPEPAWGDPKDWVAVDPKDVQGSFDKAAAEGKSTVYFPGGKPEGYYRINKTISVHGSVSRVIGLESNWFVEKPLQEEFKPVFRIENLTVPAVVFERFWTSPWPDQMAERGRFSWFENATDKAVVVRHAGINAHLMKPAEKGNGPLFAETISYGNIGVADPALEIAPGQKVWMRAPNPETNMKMVINNGGLAWMLGLKTEGFGTIVENKNGAQTEILGGLLYPAWGPFPNLPVAAINEDSSLFMVYANSAWKRDWNNPIQVRDIQNGVTRDLTIDAADVGGRGEGGFMPGFSSRAPLNPALTSAPVTVRGAAQLKPGVAQADRPLVSIATKDDTANAADPNDGAALEVTRTGATDKPLIVRYKTSGGAVAGVSGLAGTVTIAAGEKSAALNVAPKAGVEMLGRKQGAVELEPTRDYDVEGAPAGFFLIGNQAAPAPADGTGLRGEYFADMDLKDLKLTRTDPQVDFSWGEGKPLDEIDKDHFSVRWTGQIEPQFSELYTITARADDGARLWINGELLFDSFWRYTDSISADIALEKGKKYDIRYEFREDIGGASTSLRWRSASQNDAVIPTSQLFPTLDLPIVTAKATQPKAAEKGADGKPVAGCIQFTRAGGDLSRPLTVSYALRGDALNGFDEESLPGEVTIPANKESDEVVVMPKADGEIEGNERVRFDILGDADYLSGANDDADRTITIADADAPAGTGVGTGLLAAYYQGERYGGDAVAFGAFKAASLTPQVEFYWGGAPVAPDFGGSATVAATFTGFIEPRYGEEYTFYATVDDGVRLWVDGKKVIERMPWFAGTEAGKIKLEANKRVPIKMEYFNKDGAAMAVLSWESATQKKQVVPQSQLYPVAHEQPRITIKTDAGDIVESAKKPVTITVTRDGDLKNPLTVPLQINTDVAPERFKPLPDSVTMAAGQAAASFAFQPSDDDKGEPNQSVNIAVAALPETVNSREFEVNIQLRDDEIPAPDGGNGLKGEYFGKADFTELKKTRTDERVDFGWGDNAPMDGMPQDDFSIRWSGKILPQFSETYTFFVDGDDTARLLIDGKVVVDWIAPGTGVQSAQIALKKGRKYDIVMEMKEGRFGSGAHLAWQSKTQYRQIVPKSQLFTE